VIKFDHEYHGAELDIWSSPPAEMFEWLQLKFGAGNGVRWFYKHPTVYFADRKDHMMFLLRWS
jgi:hypothetical protein